MNNSIIRPAAITMHRFGFGESYEKKILLRSVIIILWLISSFKLFGPDNDYANYLDYIKYPDEIISNTIEPAFLALLKFNAWLLGSNIFFIFILTSGIALYLKMQAFSRLARYPFFCLFLYVCSYYFLHEYTQIRTAVAGAILLTSIQDIEQRRVTRFFVKCVLAMMFHYLSVIMIAAYLFVRFLPLRIFLALPLAGLSVNLMGVDVFQVATNMMGLPEQVQSLISLRVGYSDIINPFNLLMLGYYSMFFLCIIAIITRQVSPSDLILFKLLSFAIFFYLIFANSNLPVLVVRVFEFLTLPAVILFANIPNYLKYKAILSVVISLFYLAHLYHFLTNVWS